MLATTPTSLGVAAQHHVAGIVLLVRRNLEHMGAATVPPKADDKQLTCLRREVVNHGSSYAALEMALLTKPIDLDELLRGVGIYKLTGTRRQRTFDACVDGYTVFHDARLRQKI